MQELKRLPAKKAWKLMQNAVTGHIFTGYYSGDKTQIERKIENAKENRLKGIATPDTSAPMYGYVDGIWTKYVPYNGPCMSDVVLLDYIPVVRVSLKFDSLYNGTSGVAINFETPAGYTMTLRSVHANRFFELVGMGKIKMDSAGFYEFDVEFVKSGDKVYMELYGYDS